MSVKSFGNNCCSCQRLHLGILPHSACWVFYLLPPCPGFVGSVNPLFVFKQPNRFVCVTVLTLAPVSSPSVCHRSLAGGLMLWRMTPQMWEGTDRTADWLSLRQVPDRHQQPTGLRPCNILGKYICIFDLSISWDDSFGFISPSCFLIWFIYWGERMVQTVTVLDAHDKAEGSGAEVLSLKNYILINQWKPKTSWSHYNSPPQKLNKLRTSHSIQGSTFPFLLMLTLLLYCHLL